MNTLLKEQLDGVMKCLKNEGLELNKIDNKDMDYDFKSLGNLLVNAYILSIYFNKPNSIMQSKTYFNTVVRVSDKHYHVTVSHFLDFLALTGLYITSKTEEDEVIPYLFSKNLVSRFMKIFGKYK